MPEEQVELTGEIEEDYIADAFAVNTNRLTLLLNNTDEQNTNPFWDDTPELSHLFGPPPPEPKKSTLPSLKSDTSEMKQALKLFKNGFVGLVRKIWLYITVFTPRIIAKTKYTLRTYPKQSASLAVLLLLPVAILMVGVILTNNRQPEANEQSPQTLPATFSQEPQQDVYYPSKLPDGYMISADQSVNDSTLAAYTITDGNIVITLSQQKDVPEEALQALFAGAQSVTTNLGTAQIKRLENGSVAGLLRLNDTTILLNTATDIDSAVLISIFNYIELAD